MACAGRGGTPVVAVVPRVAGRIPVLTPLLYLLHVRAWSAKDVAAPLFVGWLMFVPLPLLLAVAMAERIRVRRRPARMKLAKPREQVPVNRIARADD